MSVNSNPDNVGRRIKAMRQQRNLTLMQLSKCSGVPQSTLSLIETGARSGRKLTLETGAKLARALGVSLDVIADTYGDVRQEREQDATIRA